MEQNLKRIFSDEKKRSEAYALITDRGITLKEKTKEFLDNYYFHSGSQIRASADDIIIHTEDGAWSDEVHIQKDGSYRYCGGKNCVW